MLIERQSDMRVVAEAEDGVAALESTQAERPDVAVLDVSMPRMTGLQAAREIRSHVPDTRVLLLSMHDDERYFLEGPGGGRRGLRPEACRRHRPDRRGPDGRRRPHVPLRRSPAHPDGRVARRAAAPSPTTR